MQLNPGIVYRQEYDYWESLAAWVGGEDRARAEAVALQFYAQVHAKPPR